MANESEVRLASKLGYLLALLHLWHSSALSGDYFKWSFSSLNSVLLDTSEFADTQSQITLINLKLVHHINKKLVLQSIPVPCLIQGPLARREQGNEVVGFSEASDIKDELRNCIDFLIFRTRLVSYVNVLFEWLQSGQRSSSARVKVVLHIWLGPPDHKLAQLGPTVTQ